MTKDLHLSKANVKKYLYQLSQDKTDETTAGILSEGRIFFLGRFDVDAELFDRSQVVLTNLGENVKQPFGKHAWAFCMDVKWPEQDHFTTVIGKVNVLSPDLLSCIFFAVALNYDVVAMETWDFSHTSQGFGTKRLTPMGFNFTSEFAPTCYMIAISCLNTRGCNVVRSEAVKGIKNLHSNNVQHYDVDAPEYITAIRSGSSDTGKRREGSGTRRSPIPHLRRGHERITNGKRTWVRDMLINVKAEGDVAFVDKRLAYVLK